MGFSTKAWYPLDFVDERNGFRGTVGICQQRQVNGVWALILTCGGCGAKWRCETLGDAQPVIDLLRSAKYSDRSKGFYGTIADRIDAGYTHPVEVNS